jgi:hypothetical protein
MEKAELLNVISKLTHQNTIKDCEIATLKSKMNRTLEKSKRLEAQVQAQEITARQSEGVQRLEAALDNERLAAMTFESGFFFDKARRLEASLKSIAKEEESTFAAILDLTQRTLTTAKAAINETAYQMGSNNLEEEGGNQVTTADLPTHLTTLEKAGLDIWSVKQDIHRAITVFFHMRHYLLVKCDFPFLLAEKPVGCFVVADDNDNDNENDNNDDAPAAAADTTTTTANAAGKRKCSAEDEHSDDVVERWMDEMLEKTAKRVKCEEEEL